MILAIVSLLALAFGAWVAFEVLMIYGRRIATFFVVVVLIAAPFVAFELIPPVKCWAFCGS